MKLASIVPMGNVGMTFDGEYAMILAHLAKYYPINHDRVTGKTAYTIMDNSLIELGGAVSIEQILDAADSCEPWVDEIIIPDVFKDCDATIRNVETTLKYLIKHNRLGDYRCMAVAQGCCAEEVIRCYNALSEIDEIDCIGIPKVCETLHTDGRPYFEYLWQKTNKEIHLLGVWSNMRELLEYQNPKKIRSVDTCIPALHAIHRRNIFKQRPDKTINLEKDIMDYNALEYYKSLLHILRGAGILQ